MGVPVNRIRKATDFLCVASFVMGLSVPFLGFALGWGQPGGDSPSAGDRSRPALAPLHSFPSRFEGYFRSNLGFRDLMVRWNNVVTVLWLYTTPSTRIQHSVSGLYPGDIVLGRKGWLFYFPPFSNEGYRGLDPMSDQELDLWRHHFETRRDWLAERGVDYLLVIAPEKQSVHSAFLPWAMRLVEGRTRAQQLLERLADTSDLATLDLRASLRTAALDLSSVLGTEQENSGLYHRTGTHWNELGAFIAYRDILERLRGRHPSLKPLSVTDFHVEHRTGPTRGLAMLLGIRGLMTEDYVDVIPRRKRTARPVGPALGPDVSGVHGLGAWSSKKTVRSTGRHDLPRATFLHDSFLATYLEPFLSEHFERAEYHWNEGGGRATKLLMSLVLQDPDIVVEVRSERLFDTHVPHISGRPRPRKR